MQSVQLRRRPSGRPFTSSSSSGSAYKLSSSVRNFSNGLYNSLGAAIGSRLTMAAPLLTRERSNTLKNIATKLDTGDNAGGRADAEKLLAANANDAVAIRLVAHSYMNEKNYKEAERAYSRALSLVPSSTGLRSDLANARSLQKSDREVVSDARRKIGSPSTRVEGLRLAMRLSNRSPENADAYLVMAEGFDSNRQPRQVLAALKKAVKYANDDQIDSVIVKTRKMVKRYPDAATPHNILGKALKKAGRLTDALRELETASALSPYNIGFVQDLAIAYVTRAESKLESGDAIAAQTDLHAAERIYPSLGVLKGATARLAAFRAKRDITARRYTSAVTQLSMAASKAPDDPRFKKDLATMYMGVAAHFKNEGDYSLALSSYEKAYALDPTSTTARNNVAELSHKEGLAALASLNYERAVEYLEKAYDTYRLSDDYAKDLALALDERGQRFVRTSDLDKALADLTRAVALDPSNLTIGQHFSEAYAKSLAA